MACLHGLLPVLGPAASDCARCIESLKGYISVRRACGPYTILRIIIGYCIWPQFHGSCCPQGAPRSLCRAHLLDPPRLLQPRKFCAPDHEPPVLGVHGAYMLFHICPVLGLYHMCQGFVMAS